MTTLRRHWPLFTALTGALTILLLTALQMLRNTDCRFIYALDDPYIHLSIARNLAQNGTWGVNAHAFASASSSLLWPLLLAGLIWLFGNSDLYPLLLNILLTLVLIVVSYYVMLRRGLRGAVSLVALAVMFFAGPVPAMVFSGMEHILQMLTTVLFAAAVYTALTLEHLGMRYTWPLALTALLVAATRYEGLFIVAAACVLLAARKRLVLAVVIAVAAVLPIILFGMISVSNGWYFLPNSVLLKGTTPANVASADIVAYLWRVAGHVGQMMTEAPYLQWILISGALIVLYDWVKNPRDCYSFTKVGWYLFIPTCLLHTAFASVGWFYRYEAYLVYWGGLLIAITFIQPLKENLTLPFRLRQLPIVLCCAMLVATAYFLFMRANSALQDVPVATKNIYQQQYQMSQFIKEYYSGQAVAINDIGMIGYRSGVTVIDLFGLASLDVMKLRQSHNYTPADVEELADANGVNIAIIYDEWFLHGFVMTGLPPGWVRAGSWRITNNVVAGSDTVSFYAVHREALPGLMANLQAFSSQLPDAVTQAGPYIVEP